MRHLLRTLILPGVLTGVMISTGAAWGADLTTEPGKSAVVTSTTSDITANGAEKGTTAIAVDTAKPKPNHTLLYIPPPNSGTLDDTVSYTIDGTKQSKSVHVAAADAYSPSFKIIFELFIVAVLVENGLALIFAWRPFLTVFDPKAVNSVIAFVFSLIFVIIFNFDVVNDLLAVYVGVKPGSTWPGTILTAMIIAGGSAGVNRMFQAFGFRSPLSQEQAAAPKPPPDKAWIAVTPIREKAVGPITVLIGPAGSSVAAGTIVSGPVKKAWWCFLLRDKGRFPPSGGFAVTPGTYEIRLVGRDSSTNPITSPTWGPYGIAAGALIDLRLEI